MMERIKELVLEIFLCICARVVLTLWSGKVVTAKAVIFDAEVDKEVDEGEDRLYLIKNNISVDIYYSFLDYKLFHADNYVKKERIMQIAHLNT